MKTRFLTILVSFGLLVSFPNSFAICMEDEDWPEKPCYGYPGADPRAIDERQDWEPYYEYKGAELMETKKIELLEAIRENRLGEWRSEGPTSQNNNIFLYYYFQGVIPHEDGKYYNEHKQEAIAEYYGESISERPPPNLETSVDYDYALINMIVMLTVIIGGVAGGIVFVMRRNKK